MKRCLVTRISAAFPRNQVLSLLWVLAFALLLPEGARALGQSLKVSGVLTYTAFDTNGRTNNRIVRTFDGTFDDRTWLIKSVPSPLTDVDWIKRFEARTDGTNVFVVDQFNEKYDRSKAIPLLVKRLGYLPQVQEFFSHSSVNSNHPGQFGSP